MTTITRRCGVKIIHSLPDGSVAEHFGALTLWVGGALGPTGVVIEHADLDRVVLPVLRLVNGQGADTLASRCSTAEAALVSENPTAERLVEWLAARLVGLIASAVGDRKLTLARLRLQEDAQSGAEWLP